MGLAVIAALIGFPIVELLVLIKVGGAIGILPLLLLLVATGVAGGLLLRHQGLAVLRRTLDQMARHEVPVDSMRDAIGLALAGFLLLLPGLISDVIGLLLLVPAIRRPVVGCMMGLSLRGPQTSKGHAARRGRANENGSARDGHSDQGAAVIIEGEFERVSERTLRPDPGGSRSPEASADATDGASPWQR